MVDETAAGMVGAMVAGREAAEASDGTAVAAAVRTTTSMGSTAARRAIRVEGCHMVTSTHY